MSVLKIWDIWFNDGQWSTGRTTYQAVAFTKEEAIEKILNERPHYRTGYDIICSEFIIEGYVIKVYDKRDKTIEDILE